MHITIYGDIPSKKNSKRIVQNRKTGKPLLISSKNHEAWEELQLWELKKVKKKVREKNFGMEIIFYPSNMRKSDLTNKAESIMDLLVKAEILEDDNWFIVGGLFLIFGGVDKLNPRAEITIKTT